MNRIRMFCWVLLVIQSSVWAERKRFVFLEKQMGADFRMILHAEEEAVAGQAVDAVYRDVQRLNGILSDYQADSELSRLSQSSGSGKTISLR